MVGSSKKKVYTQNPYLFKDMLRIYTHFPHRAAADGNPGPETRPVKIRITISNPTWVRAASGVRSVNKPPINIHPPNIHLAPNFSAKFPVENFYLYTVI
jgi:hypothetical protein